MKKLLTIIILGLMAFLLLNLEIFEDIEATLMKYQQVAPLIYIIIFAIAPLTFFPSSLLVIVAGRYFGFGLGCTYTLLGALLGSSIAFMITRNLVNLPKAIRDNKMVTTFSEQTSFKVVLLMRFVPVIPFDVISYGAGLSKIPYHEYALATFIGIIPGVILYTNIGAQSFDISKPGFYFAIATLVVFALVMSKIAKKVKLNTN